MRKHSPARDYPRLYMVHCVRGNTRSAHITTTMYAELNRWRHLPRGNGLRAHKYHYVRGTQQTLTSDGATTYRDQAFMQLIHTPPWSKEGCEITA